MKKIIVLIIGCVMVAACGNNAQEKKSNSDSTIAAEGVVKLDEGSEQYSYIPAAGDVSYRNGKLMVYNDGAWFEAREDVHLDSGVVVYRNGRVKKENREVVLEESQVVTKTGNFFDKTGHALVVAWDATKDGVVNAAKFVGKTTKKVGEKIGDAVDKDKDKDKKKD